MVYVYKWKLYSNEKEKTIATFKNDAVKYYKIEQKKQHTKKHIIRSHLYEVEKLRS
jgi:hypothetical protein